MIFKTFYEIPYKAGRRRRADEDVAESESQINVIDVYHPCKYVSEDVKVCIADENGELGTG